MDEVEKYEWNSFDPVVKCVFLNKKENAENRSTQPWQVKKIKTISTVSAVLFIPLVQNRVILMSLC